ncbi:MAG: hypothetical protein ACREQA_17505 [Candidatus Binatia bacterium]
MLSIDLVKHIKSDRAQKKTKQPFRSPLFERISGLVRQYALGESFLRRLDEFADHLPRGNVKFDRGKVKETFEPPLFSLSTEEEYRVTMAIMKKVNNPYLDFVNSPDEILLCGSLFRRSPSLGPDQLARYHFEILLLAELGKGGRRDLKTSKVNRGGEK